MEHEGSISYSQKSTNLARWLEEQRFSRLSVVYLVWIPAAATATPTWILRISQFLHTDSVTVPVHMLSYP
jgi:hypothetical protein